MKDGVMMATCPKCNKNRSYPNELCKICSWKDWALNGMEDQPQAIQDEFLESMYKSSTYALAGVAQALLELWLDVLDVVHGRGR